MSNIVKLLLGLATIGGSGVAISFFSYNNVTIINNPSQPTGPSTSTTSKAKSVNYASCVKDSSSTAYSVVVKVGETPKPVIKVESGEDYWGDNYNKAERCSMIAGQYDVAIGLGATGWAASMKNGFPIICAAKKDGCVNGSDGLPLQLVTFKKSVDPERLATILTNHTNVKYEGSSDNTGIIVTGTVFKYHDFGIK